MKKVLLFVAFALMLAVPSAQAETVVNLIADGRDTQEEVGEVSISNDADNLYVTFTIDSGAWEMTETHLGIDGGIIKNRSGNPKVGKFTLGAGGEPGGVDHDPAVTTHTYTIPLTALGSPANGDVIDIAAHTAIEYVEVIDADDGYPDQPLVDDILHEETAWGEGEPFNANSKKNWAMFIEYTVVIPE